MSFGQFKWKVVIRMKVVSKFKIRFVRFTFALYLNSIDLSGFFFNFSWSVARLSWSRHIYIFVWVAFLLGVLFVSPHAHISIYNYIPECTDYSLPEEEEWLKSLIFKYPLCMWLNLDLNLSTVSIYFIFLFALVNNFHFFFLLFFHSLFFCVDFEAVF